MKLPMKAVAVAVYGLVLGSAALAFEGERKEFEVQPQAKLVLRGITGSVNVRAGDQHVISVQVEKKRWDKGCDLRFSHSKAEVSAELVSPKKTNCELTLAIQVPSRTEFDVRMNAADLTIAGTNGPIRIRGGAGNVSLQQVDSPRVDAKLGSGNIEFSRLKAASLHLTTGSGQVEGDVSAEELAAKLGSGNVVLQLTPANQKGEASVVVGAGNVELALPKGLAVSSQLNSGIGSQHNDFTSNPTAPLKVKLGAGVGNVALKAF